MAFAENIKVKGGIQLVQYTHKYRSAIVCPTCSINRGTPNTHRSSTPIKTKTNHVDVIETLSTTFHFLHAFSILVHTLEANMKYDENMSDHSTNFRGMSYHLRCVPRNVIPLL